MAIYFLYCVLEDPAHHQIHHMLYTWSLHHVQNQNQNHLNPVFIQENQKRYKDLFELFIYETSNSISALLQSPKHPIKQNQFV